MNLTINEIVMAVEGRFEGNPGAAATAVSDVVTDTRKLVPGCLFVALPGRVYDGHDYIEAALNGGAMCALSVKEIPGREGQIIRCGDTLAAYGKLARYYKMRWNLPCVAVTGSVGKTTTKEMLACVLREKYCVHATEGNLNNAIGLPATILASPADTELLVLEMGMNAFGEIAYLSEIANPDIAVITNIGTAHIQNLGSREGIAAAKLEILRGIKAGGGCVLLNGDEPLLREAAIPAGIERKLFGIAAPGAEFTASDIVTGEESSAFTVKMPDGESETFHVPAAGTHNIYNALAAISAGLRMGLTPAQIRAGLENFRPSSGRQNILDVNGILYIEDTYNASPESVLASLEVMRMKSCTGRRIAVLGDMLELGGYAPEGHRRAGRAVGENGIDELYCFGEHSAETVREAAKMLDARKCHHYATKQELIEAFMDVPREGDMILFKASRGMRMEDVITALNEHRARTARPCRTKNQ